MSPSRPHLLAGLLLLATGLGCGSSSRPAAHPDFRALQVHEARVSELTSVVQDESRPCEDRSAAAQECGAEVDRAQQDLAGVHDEDASARISRLAQQCDAARASIEGRCGQGS